MNHLLTRMAGHIVTVLAAAAILVTAIITGKADLVTMAMLAVVVIAQALVLIGYAVSAGKSQRKLEATPSATAALAERGRR